MLGHVLFRCAALSLSGYREVNGRRLGNRPAPYRRERLPGRHSRWPGPVVLCHRGHRVLPRKCSRPGANLRSIDRQRAVARDSRRTADLAGFPNRFRLQDDEEVTAVRVDIYPDGGFSRLHLLGQLSPKALAAAISQWLLRLPPPRPPIGYCWTPGSVEPRSVNSPRNSC